MSILDAYCRECGEAVGNKRARATAAARARRSSPGKGVGRLTQSCCESARTAVVTPADQQKFGIGWSLKLTNEGGYVIALLLGLVIANFFPRLAEWLSGPSSTSRSPL